MVPLKLLGVHHSEENPAPVVLLQHEDRILPILVGIQEASAIHFGLIGEKPIRPMTHDLVCNLLAGLRGVLQSVTIYKLENDTFYAHLNIEQKSRDGQVEQVLRIDTRPSDGIAIATRVSCPIYASEEVMDAASQSASLLESDDEEAEDEEFES